MKFCIHNLTELKVWDIKRMKNLFSARFTLQEDFFSPLNIVLKRFAFEF